MGCNAMTRCCTKKRAWAWHDAIATTRQSKHGQVASAWTALALAPIVDRGLSWFTVKFKFESQGKLHFLCIQAFMAIVGFCFGLALILFFIVTLLWA
ncbi:hypothetical protein CK203_033997 [Vitis vinifera]|uniref:Uncharacterized protein n=1 Tax=Vitis vinifera TaxID=29760 RepID=A0A438IBD4_VITVI|nr:hypothetical protein CK203_033997 [Vitis vinifera]